MAVDERTKLKITLGSVVHTLPLYDTYSDFYNDKYLTIKTFNKTLYAPLSSNYSSLAINAGVEKAGKKYYLLTRAYKKDEQFNSLTDPFFRRISRGGTIPKQVTLSTLCEIPESGAYNVSFVLNWSVGKRGHHNGKYPLYGVYVALGVEQDGSEILSLKGNLRNNYSVYEDYAYYSKSYPYYPTPFNEWGMSYISRYPEQPEMTSHLADFNLGHTIIFLNAGTIKFNLTCYLKDDDTGGYAPVILLNRLKVIPSRLGYSSMSVINNDTNWVLPKDALPNIKALIFGAGGGGKKGGGYYDGDGDYYSYIGSQGGSGEYLEKELVVSPNKVYPITVGKGGIPSNAGGSTSAFGFTARGGGGASSSEGTSYGDGSKGGLGSLGDRSALSGEDGKVLILYNLKGEV